MSDEYSDNFVYRPPVEPTQDVVPVALVFGSVAPPAGPGTIMNQLQGASVGADLFNGTLL